ncbi:hypothetical protein [Streptomyces sp. NPDC052042]|uniref:hypothetical protein n=1 Tax=Streptomyces sp. NPDC052042 TaxID=3365683 RepID=UPI0037CF3F20
MADTSPQGRSAVAKALRELTAFGYYRVLKFRREDGTFFSEAHVYDTPQPTAGAGSGSGVLCQVVPGAGCPGSGEPTAGDSGSHPVKDRRENPSLPGRRRRPTMVGATDAPAGAAEVPADTASAAEAPVAGGVRTAGEARTVMEAFGDGPGPESDAGNEPGAGRSRADKRAAERTAEGHGVAVATLFRVIGPEPRLRLGTVEALALAPLVATWLERGYDQRDLTGALLGGLPARIHSTSALLRDRLTRKLPPPSEATSPGCSTPKQPGQDKNKGKGKPRWDECEECGHPIPRTTSLCSHCAPPLTTSPDTPPRARTGSDADADAEDTRRAETTTRGRALVRAALREPRP